MAVTLITTVSGTTSNSYNSLVELAAHMNNLLGAECWLESGADDQARAAIKATEIIDQRNYIGSKTDPDQSLQFPRRNYGRRYVAEISSGDGIVDLRSDFWPANAIPRPIKLAHAQLSLQRLQAILNGESETEGAVAAIAVSGLSVSYSKPVTAAGVLPSEIAKLLGPFLIGKQRVRG